VHDDDLINQVRNAPGPGRISSAAANRSSLFDEPTRLGDVDAELLLQTRPDEAVASGGAEYPPKFLPATTELAPMQFDDIHGEDEATRLANVDGIMPPKRQPPAPSRQAPPPSRRGARHDPESTRAVDVRNDPSINDIDWDID
jgi:hypothetical protein